MGAGEVLDDQWRGLVADGEVLVLRHGRSVPVAFSKGDMGVNSP
jgi:hypothetical protein